VLPARCSRGNKNGGGIPCPMIPDEARISGQKPA
jgi:hypothetical protein